MLELKLVWMLEHWLEQTQEPKQEQMLLQMLELTLEC
jgi:hypothetical protein